MSASLADAQQSRIPRIAYVWIFTEGPSAPYANAFRERLRELGWIDGKTVVIETHDANGSPEKLDAIMRGLVDSKVDVIVTACTPQELSDALDLLPTTGTQAILNTGDTLLSNQGPKVIAFAAQRRLPTLFESRAFGDQGGLMSFGPNFPALHRRAAEYVDKILKGAKPGDLPIEQPTKFELVVNMKTAKALGFTIPQSMLLRADEVIR